MSGRLSQSGLLMLEALDQAELFSRDFLVPLVWQAAVGILYLGWLLLWWLHAQGQKTSKTLREQRQTKGEITMDAIKILKRAWHIVWNYRALWVFGILLALTAGSTTIGRSTSNYHRNWHRPARRADRGRHCRDLCPLRGRNRRYPHSG
jgi:hypothetical protein